MFRKQPPLPHCENLTKAQLKLVRKLIDANCANYPQLVQDAYKNGGSDIFVALAKTRFAYKADVFRHFINLCTGDEAVEVFSSFSPGLCSQSDFIVQLIECFDSDVIRKIVAMPMHQSVRTKAAYRIMREVRQHDTNLINEYVLKLLVPPFDANYDRGVLMRLALYGGRFIVADALRDLGFNMADHHLGFRYFFSEDGKQCSYKSEALSYIDNHAAATSAEPQVLGVRYQRRGEYVSCSDVLPDGSTLNTVFNFAAAQQMIFVRIGDHASTPAVLSFNAIADRGQLKEAATAYVSQGGDEKRVAHLLSSRPISFKQMEA